MKKKPLLNDWQTPLDAKKLSAFEAKVQDMADRTFGVDHDGDSALEVRLVDRTTTQCPLFRAIPYGHMSDEARREAFEVAVFNLRVAFSSFDVEDRIRQAERRKA